MQQLLLLCFLACLFETIHSSERQSCCGNRAVLNECASACAVEPTCENPNPVTTPGPCTLQCIIRCECIAGYIRNEQDGKCIRIESCSKSCGRNAFFNKCASACAVEPTCENPIPNTSPVPCTLQCVKRCQCESGYIRSKQTGKCVKLEECPKLCGRNAIFDECASACEEEPTCTNPNPLPTPVPCTKQCVKRCLCKDGFVRNEQTGKCIRYENCCRQCPMNEHLGCRPCCKAATCQNRNPKSCIDPCPKICILECQCNSGYLRNEETGQCVLEKHCPI